MIILGKAWAIAMKKLRLAKNKTEEDVAKAISPDISALQIKEFEKADGKTTISIEKDATQTVADAIGATPAEVADAVAEAQSELDKAPPAETPEEKAAKEAAAKKAADDEEAKKIAEGKKKNAPQFNILKIDDGGKGSNGETFMDKNMKKAAIYRELCKAIVGEKAYEKVSKGNILVPGDLSPSGNLTPAQSGMLISLMVDESDFLKKIQVKRMRSTKQDVNVWDLTGRKLTRQAAGFFPQDDANMTNVINKSLTLSASKVNLKAIFTQESHRAYDGDLATFEQDIVNGFVIQIANEIVDLGFNGLADTSGLTELTWTNLAKGWYKRSQESAPGGQIVDVSTGGYTTVIQKFNALLNATRGGANKRFFGRDTPVVMSGLDRDTYDTEILSRADSTPLLVNGAPSQYLSRPLIDNSYLDTNQMLHSQLPNFVLGIVGGDQQGITMEALKVPEADLIWCSVYLDFEMVNYGAVGVLQP